MAAVGALRVQAERLANFNAAQKVSSIHRTSMVRLIVVPTPRLKQSSRQTHPAAGDDSSVASGIKPVTFDSIG